MENIEKKLDNPAIYNSAFPGARLPRLLYIASFEKSRFVSAFVLSVRPCRTPAAR